MSQNRNSLLAFPKFNKSVFILPYKKQMFDSVFTGKENASKNWNCILSMFLTSFNIYFSLVVHVLFVAYRS